MTGPDRSAFLHNLLSNDIKTLLRSSSYAEAAPKREARRRALTPDRSCEAALLTPSGKFLAHLLVLAESDAHWLLVDRSRIEIVLSTLNRYLIMEQVTLADVSNAYTVFSLHGPKTTAVVGAVGQATTVRLVNYPVVTKDDRLLIVPAEQAVQTRDRLVEAAAVPIGWDTLNVLRIEAGIPWYGIDMDESNLLPETGVEERLVSYTKGCYVGQEVVARLQTYGSVSQKLVGLVCEGTVVPERGDEILKDGQPVGHITSACFSPRLERPLALGYVKRPFYETGTQVTITHKERAISATLK